MTETIRSPFRKRAAALAVASCLSLAPWLAEAASLGKLTVYSGLGQPLRAELDIGANREELVGMTAKLAPADVFSQTGLDFAPVLRDLRFAVEKKNNGQSVVKVTSIKPINEPFLDFLVELNWPAGRLVREYTFLLDPPELMTKGMGGQVSVAEAKVVETVRGGRAEPAKPAAAPAPIVEKPVPAAPQPAPKPAPAAKEDRKTEDVADKHLVKPGETLRKIASDNKFDGVSLEQMLVALFKNNPDAFIGQNINRLKSGAILGLPDKARVESVSEAEAKKIYNAQSADWNAYRQKLAAATAKAPAREEAAGQASGGKIVAKVEEKTPAAEQNKDQVKVSKTETPAKGNGAAGKGAAEADLIAREKALKESQERLALLEKNVGELQKLLDMKSQKLAELERANTKKDEPKAAEPVKPAEVAKPAEPVKPVEEPKVAVPEKAPEPAKVAEEAKPAEAAKPAEVKPVEPAKQVPPVPKVPSAQPEAPEVEEQSLVDTLLEDPLPLAGGGGILALLAGYLLFKRRRQQHMSPETTAAPGPSSLGPNSVFRMTGGQSVDTANTPPQTGDFSQTGPGTIDTDEVDPVAEADVYMAYGRDTQAEEILLEALQKDPQRIAIHAKLLEIYSNRKSVKQFETLASELYAQTGGVGAEWEKVMAMGRALDPMNPLYSGGRGESAVGAFDVDATLVASPEDLGALALALGDDEVAAPAQPVATDSLSPTSDAEADLAAAIVETKTFEPLLQSEPVENPAFDASDIAADDSMGLDFDLGDSLAAADEAGKAQPAEAPVADPFMVADGNALDFDLASVRSELGLTVPPEAASADDAALVDFDFGLDAQAPAQVDEESSPAGAPDFSPEGTLVMAGATPEFGVTTFVGMEEAAAEPEEKPVPAPFAEMPAVDFDLDLDAPATQTVAEAMNELDASATVVNPQALIDEVDAESEASLLQTTVNPAITASDDSLEFDVNLTDSVFLGEPAQQDFDIGSINLDLAAPPESTPVASVAEPMPAERNAQWEEVNTKLDLAKAYEEMGDLEGARELLQEVVGEGSTDLVEEARSILGRIGG